MLHQINFWLGWGLTVLSLLFLFAGIIGVSLSNRIEMEHEDYDENVVNKIAPMDGTRTEIKKAIQKKNWVK